MMHNGKSRKQQETAGERRRYVVEIATG